MENDYEFGHLVYAFLYGSDNDFTFYSKDEVVIFRFIEPSVFKIEVRDKSEWKDPIGDRIVATEKGFLWSGTSARGYEHISKAWSGLKINHELSNIIQPIKYAIYGKYTGTQCGRIDDGLFGIR